MMTPAYRPSAARAVKAFTGALYRAVRHEDEFQRASGHPPATANLPDWPPPDEVRTETERANAMGRAPQPGKPERGFPPKDEDDAEAGS